MAIVNIDLVVTHEQKTYQVDLPAGSYFLNFRESAVGNWLEIVSFTPDTRAPRRTLKVLVVEAGEFVPTHARYIGSAGELHAFTV